MSVLFSNYRNPIFSSFDATLKRVKGSQDDWTLRVVKGSLETLSSCVRAFVQEKAELCRPAGVYVCDGSEQENRELMAQMEQEGIAKRLTKYENW